PAPPASPMLSRPPTVPPATQSPPPPASAHAPAAPAAPAAGRTRPTQPSSPDILFTDPVELPEGPEASVAQKTPEEILLEARDRFQLHDFAGAVEILEGIPEADPVFKEARALLAESRGQLMRMYESKLGSLDRVPRVLISSEELIWLNLNHRAG